MRGENRELDTEWRGRWGLVAAFAAACASLVVVLSPDLGQAFDSLSGNPGYRPLYPIRLELRPKIAQSETGESSSGIPASDGAKIGSFLAPGEPGAQSAHPEQVAAGDRRLFANRGQPDMLPLDFDISPGASSGTATGGSQIETVKSMSLNGVEVGSIKIRVGRDSRIYLDRAELAQRLAALDRATGAQIEETVDQPFLSFDELRNKGISVRYDPVADRIRLEL